MMLERLFFELIQVAVGTRQSLTRVPTAREWGEMYEMATRQALVGVCFVALQRMKPSDTLELSETLRLRWLGMAAKIQQRNLVMNGACDDVCKTLMHDGFRVCVLKGQGNMINYPDWLRNMRTSGDIDVWVEPVEDIAVANKIDNDIEYIKYTGRRSVIEYANIALMQHGSKPLCNFSYHHIELNGVFDVDVELHFRPFYFNSMIANRRLRKWVSAHAQWCVCDARLGEHVIPIPTSSFNAIYQLGHINRHLFEEGIGLRQLLDYYFVLRVLHIEQGSLADRTQSMAQLEEGKDLSVISNVEIMHQLNMFGIDKLAAAVMFVLQKVLAMPDEYLLCSPDERRGRFLLNEIMIAGNFGRYDKRIVNEHLGGLRSLHKNFLRRVKRDMRFLKFFPQETLWEPIFRVYFHFWRGLRLWRFE